MTVLAIFIGVQKGVLWVAYFLVIAKAMSYLFFLVVLNYQIPFKVIKLLTNLKGPVITFLILTSIHYLSIEKHIIIDAWTLLIIMVFATIINSFLFHKEIIVEVFKVLKLKNK